MAESFAKTARRSVELHSGLAAKKKFNKSFDQLPKDTMHLCRLTGHLAHVSPPKEETSPMRMAEERSLVFKWPFYLVCDVFYICTKPVGLDVAVAAVRNHPWPLGLFKKDIKHKIKDKGWYPCFDRLHFCLVFFNWGFWRIDTHTMHDWDIYIYISSTHLSCFWPTYMLWEYNLIDMHEPKTTYKYSISTYICIWFIPCIHTWVKTIIIILHHVRIIDPVVCNYTHVRRTIVLVWVNIPKGITLKNNFIHFQVFWHTLINKDCNCPKWCRLLRVLWKINIFAAHGDEPRPGSWHKAAKWHDQRAKALRYNVNCDALWFVFDSLLPT